MLDHQHQKRVREERDRLLSRSSFTSDLQIETELNELADNSVTHGHGLYTLAHVCAYLKTKGFVIEELKKAVEGIELFYFQGLLYALRLCT